MELIGSFGRMAMDRMHQLRGGAMRGGGALVQRALDHPVVSETIPTLESALVASLAGFLSAKRTISGHSGKFLGLPVPAVMAGVLAGGALLAGDYSHHFLNLARGGLDAQATLAGVKYAYQRAGQSPAVVAGAPYGAIGVGATPELDALYAEAGLPRAA